MITNTRTGQNFGAVELGKSPPNKARSGHSRWIENGVWFEAPTVSSATYGGHDYAEGGFERGIRECKCGCHMGGYSSSGPVDPFGACPLNPRKGQSVGRASKQGEALLSKTLPSSPSTVVGEEHD